MEVKERLSSFSAEEINKKLYEYAADIDYQVDVFKIVYLPGENNASKVKKTPAEYLVESFYTRLVEKELIGLFGEVCDVDFFYIIYHSKRNQLEIEAENGVVLASVGCDELTKKSSNP